MKAIGLFIALVSTVLSHAQTDSLFFKSEREMLEYAFQNTDLTNETDGLFLDYWESPDSVWMVMDTISSLSPLPSDHIYQVGSILDRADFTGDFNREDLFHPIFDHIQTLDHTRTMKVPIIMYDTKIHNLTPSARTTIENWSSVNPFPLMNATQFEEHDFFFGSVMFDSIPYDTVVLYFDQNTLRSNTDRTLDYINIEANGSSHTLYAGDELDITNWAGNVSVLFEYVFEDGSFEIVEQEIEKVPPTVTAKDAFFDFIYAPSLPIIYDETNTHVDIDNPKLSYSIKYGCHDHKILKPFILVAGWGTHTDIDKVNDVLGWPSNLHDWAVSTNEAGFIEELHEQGYDIIMAKFYPPNASILKNAELLERLIVKVNEQKMEDGSYEENILCGYSAGALAIKHTLLAMEKKYLDNSGPHHHTKLYISYDGEHQGANIPLGLQHHVKYLYEYEHSNNMVWFNKPGWSPGAAMYALNYILEAPLSQELLAYFHSETGDSNNPGQGPAPLRNTYLADQASNNHGWNWLKGTPGYPAFCRNISISNGTSVPDIDIASGISNHYPFPTESADIYFKGQRWNRRWEASFVGPGETRVFSFDKKPAFSANWGIQYEANTLDMPVLDNAPGGTIFLKNNPLDAVIDVSNFEMMHGTAFNPSVFKYSQYSFTPTVLTHDVKNFDPFANGGMGYMTFDFQEEDLNFDNEFDANPNVNIPSNSVGYPHLGYPTDHYDVVPFDALYTWDQNTEHVTASEVEEYIEEGFTRYQPKWSDSKNVIKNFMVEEAEPAFVFLQNDRIGKEADGAWPYRVDYKADKEIYMGNHVTQKTDFKDIILDNHAIVTTMAGEAIYIKDGFHAEPGTEWHAYIDVEFCTKSLSTGSNNAVVGSGVSAQDPHTTGLETPSSLLIVPNPAKNEVQFLIRNTIDNESFSYYLTDLSGNNVAEGQSSEGTNIPLELNAGIYIVALKTNTSWYTEKLIIQ